MDRLTSTVMGTARIEPSSMTYPLQQMAELGNANCIIANLGKLQVYRDMCNMPKLHVRSPACRLVAQPSLAFWLVYIGTGVSRPFCNKLDRYEIGYIGYPVRSACMLGHM